MLNFLGIGSAFNTELGNTCAFFKRQSSILFIDCGSNVFSRIKRLDMLKDISNLYIIITHTHPDHVGSLGELIFYCHYILNKKPVIFFPDSCLLSSILGNMGVNTEFYQINSATSAKIQDDSFGIVDLTFIPSSHVNNIPSYGILLKNDGQKIYYSGDSNEISPSILESLEKGDIDYFYQDTCSIDYEGNPHLFIGKLEEYIKPHLRSKVYCIHIDEKFEKGKALDLGFNVAKLVEA